MKRIIAIPVLLIYFMAITGAIINLHYCGGRLSSLEMSKGTTCCCKAAGEGNAGNAFTHYAFQTKDDCCSNTVIAIKITSQQLHTSDYQVAADPGIVTAIIPYAHFEFINAHNITDRLLTANPVHAPPGLWQGMPLYKLHQSFILYS